MELHLTRTKEEVLKAYEESKNDENLIPVENIFKNK